MPEFKGEAPFWKFGLSDPFHPASLPIGLPSGGHLNVTTQVPGSQAIGKGEPLKTAAKAASIERPCLRMVER